jgi:hypothetical protein
MVEDKSIELKGIKISKELIEIISIIIDLLIYIDHLYLLNMIDENFDSIKERFLLNLLFQIVCIMF